MEHDQNELIRPIKQLPLKVERDHGDLIRRRTVSTLPGVRTRDLIRCIEQLPLDMKCNHGDLFRRPEQLSLNVERHHGNLNWRRTVATHRGGRPTRPNTTSSSFHPMWSATMATFSGASSSCPQYRGYDEELPSDVERNSGDLIRLIEQLPPDVEDDYGNLILLMKVLPLDVEHDHGELMRRPEQLPPNVECDHGNLNWRRTVAPNVKSYQRVLTLRRAVSSLCRVRPWPPSPVHRAAALRYQG
ncbi:hypothetical protein MRX96_057199 [Rhipicephalus microplus]